MLPVALKSGNTSMKTATETIPKQRTSAFSTLEYKILKQIIFQWEIIQQQQQQNL
jgi:hypothetical protein